jgi:hypothetical protein
MVIFPRNLADNVIAGAAVIPNWRGGQMPTTSRHLILHAKLDPTVGREQLPRTEYAIPPRKQGTVV